MRSKSIKLAILIFTSLLFTNSLFILPTNASYDVCSSGASAEVKEAAGCSGYGTPDKLPNLIQNILLAIIAVAGTIAVVFIVVGGINYITSSGDTNKIQKAKNTILYACIGLIICVLSFAIVNWVIGIL